jgi:hypothetical protein
MLNAILSTVLGFFCPKRDRHLCCCKRFLSRYTIRCCKIFLGDHVLDFEVQNFHLCTKDVVVTRIGNEEEIHAEEDFVRILFMRKSVYVNFRI